MYSPRPRCGDAHHDRPLRHAELDGIHDELVEHLREQVRCAHDDDALIDRVEDELARGVGHAIAVDAASYQADDVDRLAFGIVEALLQPRGLGHSREDLRKTVEPALRTIQVHARLRRHAKVFAAALQVFERAADHRDRRAQFVRQAVGELLAVRRRISEPSEHRREASRQVADLVAGVRPGRDVTHAPLRIDRLLDLVAQAAHARGQA